MATFTDNSVANFFFSLAMATKMVAAWSAAKGDPLGVKGLKNYLP